MTKSIKSSPIVRAAVNALTQTRLEDLTKAIPVAFIPTFDLGINCTDVLFCDGHIEHIEKPVQKVFNDFLLKNGRNLQSLMESHNIKKLHKHQVFSVDEHNTYVTLTLREDFPSSSLSNMGFVNAHVLNIDQMELTEDKSYVITRKALKKMVSISLLPNNSSSIPMPYQQASDIKDKVMYKIYDVPHQVQKLFKKAEKLHKKTSSSPIHFRETNLNIFLFAFPSDEEIQKMTTFCTHANKAVLTEPFNPAKDMAANANNASVISVWHVKNSYPPAKHILEKELRDKNKERKLQASNESIKYNDPLNE